MPLTTGPDVQLRLTGTDLIPGLHSPVLFQVPFLRVLVFRREEMPGTPRRPLGSFTSLRWSGIRILEPRVPLGALLAHPRDIPRHLIRRATPEPGDAKESPRVVPATGGLFDLIRYPVGELPPPSGTGIQ